MALAGFGNIGGRVVVGGGVKFGIYVPTHGPYGDTALLRDLAVAAEAAGWDGFFVWDILTAYDDPVIVDPWVVLAAVAEATTRIAIGPMVVPLPRRHPAKLAIEARSLQSLSAGRLILGVGVGAGEDYERFGDRTTRADRAARLDEGVVLLKAMLSGEPVDHAGEHYQVTGVRFEAVDVPVWTSGFWPRRGPVRGALGAVGCFPQTPGGDEEFPLPTPADVAAFREAFVEAGGAAEHDVAIWSPTDTGAPDRARVPAYVEAGVTWWFQDGWKLPVADLRRRIAAGPPKA